MKTACFWFLFMCSWGGYSQLLNSNPELLFTGSSCIYSLNLDAQEAEVHVYFTDSLVEYADNLTKASDGNFYQITGGGRSGSFIVCKLDAVTYDISVEIEIPVLFQPSDDKTLVSVGDGKLYGFSWLGGDYELGYLFSYDIGQKEFEVIHHFQNKSERVNLDLVSDNQNFLYGLSTEGRITQFNISTKEFNVIGTLPNLGIEHGLLYAHDGYLYTLFSDWPNEKPDQILKISLPDGNVSEVYQDSVLGFDGFKLLEINGILYTTIYNSNNPVNPRYIGAYNLATSEFYLEQPLEGEVNSGLRNASNGSISYTTQINLGNGVYSNEINLYKPLVGRLVQADLPHGYVGLGIAEISKNLVVLSNQNGVNDVAEFDINGDSIRVVKRNYPNNGSFTLKHSLVKGNKRFCYGVTTHY